MVGNVLSQSGSFQYVLGSIDEDLSPFVEGGWLIPRMTPLCSKRW